MSVILALVAGCASAETSTAPDIELVTSLPSSTSSSTPAAVGLGGLGRTDVTAAPEPIVDDVSTTPSTDAPKATSTTEAPKVASTTTIDVTTTTAAATPTPTTAPTTTTTEFVVPPWRVGLVNSGSANFDAYRLGVEAALAWRNAENEPLGLRDVALTACTSDDPVSASSCADQLVTNSDVLVRGIDTNHSVTSPIFENSGLAVLGGYALWAEDLTSSHLFDVGGPPAMAAALAGHAVDLGDDVVAVFHDDNTAAATLMELTVTPLLSAAEVTVELIPVPAGTIDATGLASQAAIAGADSWIVLSGSSSCTALAQSHAAFGSTAPVIWGENCAVDGIRDQVAAQVSESWFGVEIVESWLLPVVSSDLRGAYELAALGLAQVAPELADDPLAHRGWVTGLHVVDLLQTSGANAQSARLSRLPHPMSPGELNCNTAPVCASDVMVVEFRGGAVSGAPRIVNGLARIA